MKTRLSILLLILTFCQSYSQLQIDAGDDLIICLEEVYPDLPTLGGNPTAIGGEEEPYTYIWSTKYETMVGPYWASTFLDDSTAANPNLIEIVRDSLIFTLTVIDNVGNQAEDSIKLRFSNFLYYLIECDSYINRGDTARLFCNAVSNIVPLTYTWSPNYNISDTTDSNPLAWPDSNFTYTVIATDSYGCKSSAGECEIYVNPLDIPIIESHNVKSSVYPNPIDNSSILIIENYEARSARLKIYNSNGKLIFYSYDLINPFRIGELIKESGVYFYTLCSDNEIFSNGQFVKK